MDYATQTAYSDPGRYAELFDALPGDLPGVTAVVQNVVIHYRCGIEFSGERLEEVNNRWVEAILDADQRRHGTPLAVPRAVEDRVAGCCRDYALLLVSALRHQGIPARTRIGFASYFRPGWNVDHVIAEYWNGERWVSVDAQLSPRDDWGFDVQDVPFGPFRSAAEVWRAFRAGEIDGETYGVDPALPMRGGPFIRDYVLLQAAHLQGDELLLWDVWGGMANDLDRDLTPTDELAALLIAVDAGDDAAATKLHDWYHSDPDLHPGARIQVHSPTGTSPYWIDLGTRRRVAGHAS
ncbi:transglutaminase-like domain-containing protein [Kribbella sp. CA-253562]|uniref:transglutaminase-like domain-containing protein n=1 Tax=Kribbella sp. CA-253562 TaxID=3239942 RepID=UPI003D91D0EB